MIPNGDTFAGGDKITRDIRVDRKGVRSDSLSHESQPRKDRNKSVLRHARIPSYSDAQSSSQSSNLCTSDPKVANSSHSAPKQPRRSLVDAIDVTVLT
ncbi:hypothetical protein TNCV_1432921 [Trichonephila clavipes]|nr:hypothetical protein TNCV_1432921 [Trichonephila clavipes]